MISVPHLHQELQKTVQQWLEISCSRGVQFCDPEQSLPEELDAGAEGGAVALGQAGGGVAEGGQTVQALQDRGAGDRLAPGDLEDQEDQGRLDPSCLHDANIWNNHFRQLRTMEKVVGKYQ